MPTTVKLDDLMAAQDWVSASESAALMDCSAYVSRATGQVHWLGEGVEEEPPPDIHDPQWYEAVPNKSDLDLGRTLALSFVTEYLPARLSQVNEVFRRRGAYGRFKAVLAGAGLLERWYDYEQAATADALRAWCEEQGFAPDR